jgi:hypothetical protein
MKKPTTKNDPPEQVNEFMVQLEHPLKTEVQVIREIIKGLGSSYKTRKRCNHEKNRFEK